MFYSLYIPPFGDYADARALAELARDAEDAGWDGFFLWDHVFMDWPDRVVDPWVALSAIAMNTERIRIGTLVTPLPRRRPWKLARETVSLDHLSRGRLILGVGLGIYRTEFDDLGEPVDLKVRAEMLDEGLDVLTGLWRSQPFSHSGKYYEVKGAHFAPPPVQSPRIPIWVAALWPNRAPMRRAARWDGIYPLNRDNAIQDLTPDQVRDVISYVRQHRQSEAPFDVVHRGTTSGENPERDAEIAASYAEVGATWWLENIHPWRFGWNQQGSWPMSAMRERILQGPPRTQP
jgi:probable F420-dependent oxidoreductase